MDELHSFARVQTFHDEIKNELLLTHSYEPVDKDILIVVHNQLPYIRACLESIQAATENYNLYVWDNASDEETKNWLRTQADIRTIKVLLRSEENLGFIVPNNELARLTKSPYIVLLNSDTVVSPGWDKAIVTHLQLGYAQVGFSGGYVAADFKGNTGGFGSGVDYIEGWAVGLTRGVYNNVGLFDSQNLRFAYGEDFDLSMRIKEAGYSVYALHLDLVKHFGHKTITEVAKTRDCRKSYEDNHLYLAGRWKSVLTAGADLCHK